MFDKKTLMSCAFAAVLFGCVREFPAVVESSVSGKDFISRWRIDGGGTRVVLPLVTGFNYDFVVDWGDGASSEISLANDHNAMHSYALAGEYTVTIDRLLGR